MYYYLFKGLSLTAIEEKLFGTDELHGWFSKCILNYYGIDHSNVIVYPAAGEKVVLPKCAILMEKMGRFSHYLLYFDGKFYDPNLGIMEEYDMTKLVGYLEIKL